MYTLKLKNSYLLKYLLLVCLLVCFALILVLTVANPL